MKKECVQETKNAVGLDVTRDKMQSEIKFDNNWGSTLVISTVAVTASVILSSALADGEKPRKLGKDREISSKDALALRAKMLNQKSQDKSITINK